jgi:hypothetical protein
VTVQTHFPMMPHSGLIAMVTATVTIQPETIPILAQHPQELQLN